MPSQGSQTRQIPLNKHFPTKLAGPRLPNFPATCYVNAKRNCLSPWRKRLTAKSINHPHTRLLTSPSSPVTFRPTVQQDHLGFFQVGWDYLHPQTQTNQINTHPISSMVKPFLQTTTQPRTTVRNSPFKGLITPQSQRPTGGITKFQQPKQRKHFSLIVHSRTPPY